MVKYSYDRREASYASTIEVDVHSIDGEKALIHLLKFIKWIGDVGAGRSICVEDKNKNLIYWDGDGADKLGKILLNGKEVGDFTKEDREEFDRLTR
jgi:hypothetical protein